MQKVRTKTTLKRHVIENHTFLKLDLKKITMKNFKLLVCIIFICIYGTNCKSQSALSINCPIVIGPVGLQVVISYESAKKNCNNRIKFVDIGQKTKRPWSGYDAYENWFEKLKNDSAIKVSIVKYIITPNVGQIKRSSAKIVKGVGKNSYWLGSTQFTNDRYIMNQDSSFQIIANGKFFNKPTGISQILMTKGTGQKDYYAGLGEDDKIYKAKGENGVEQVGIASYFWIPLESNPKLQRAIVMTKGMSQNEKWCGELDGTIYIQK